jgi:hypothetical protein
MISVIPIVARVSSLFVGIDLCHAFCEELSARASGSSSGERNRARERWTQRGFSPADLLNLWQPNGDLNQVVWITTLTPRPRMKRASGHF